ncbi:CD82 antigen-like isoform X1 [Syngnathus typhle]|uniref:CD82 antigen-like isoform X1 n=1 Tax=Syngnathus typhle TaxID=161592 RepID=UPI002A69D280|nr:CD82 antigen-like isoform X1 [Syngnathus typhle]XP_061139979.1 CD82 antigen-like isoform X1 [Syngnathus typhle]XP_061139980.1 CD82 antigen-like isoform X1 [Syngnathus typhle]XP_061139981.1 CD82 antigen-like isoform X1 [Syngnathus typhle]XP_061139982.1 CD82 antigen-like isoform X1 [Syngnathus typhle]
MSVAKCFLVILNVIIFVFGVLIMGFGLWVLSDTQRFIAVLQESAARQAKVSSYIFIGVGSLSIALGFLGCIGAIYEIRCLLRLYFTCVLLILIAEVIIGIPIYFQRDRVYLLTYIREGGLCDQLSSELPVYQTVRFVDACL